MVGEGGCYERKVDHSGGEGKGGEVEKRSVEVKKGMMWKETQGEVRKGEKKGRGRREMERCTLCTEPAGLCLFLIHTPSHTHTKAKRGLIKYSSVSLG